MSAKKKVSRAKKPIKNVARLLTKAEVTRMQIDLDNALRTLRNMKEIELPLALANALIANAGAAGRKDLQAVMLTSGDVYTAIERACGHVFGVVSKIEAARLAS